MPNIGTTGFILIILVALLLFGPSKLPELGRAFGRTLREFKNGAKDIMGDSESESRKDVTPAAISGHVDTAAHAKAASDNKLPE